MKHMWLAALICCVAGCQGSPPASAPAATGTGAGGRRLTIAVIPKMRENPVFKYPRIGAERAARQLGNVDVVWEGPAKDDPAKQASIVDDMAARHVDGILISVANPDVLRAAIDRAAAQGIKVVTFDSDSPRSKRLGYYGVNDTELGSRLGQEIARLLQGKGKVAILSGSRGALNLQLRDRAVRSALTRFPGIQPMETFYCEDDVPHSVQIVSDVTRAQKPDGWVFVGGWPLFSPVGLSALTPGKPKVVSADPLPPTWKWLEQNYVQVCLGQKVFGWGEEGLKLVVRAIKGEKIPVQNNSGFDVVTPQTLPQYKKQWAIMEKTD